MAAHAVHVDPHGAVGTPDHADLDQLHLVRQVGGGFVGQVAVVALGGGKPVAAAVVLPLQSAQAHQLYGRAPAPHGVHVVEGFPS